jgi:hypothetical protein
MPRRSSDGLKTGSAPATGSLQVDPPPAADRSGQLIREKAVIF